MNLVQVNMRCLSFRYLTRKLGQCSSFQNLDLRYAATYPEVTHSFSHVPCLDACLALADSLVMLYKVTNYTMYYNSSAMLYRVINYTIYYKRLAMLYGVINYII